MSKLYNKIKSIIDEKGLKLTFILTKTGFSKSYFYDLLHGKTVPSLANARKLAKVLGVTVDELFPEEIENKEVS